MPAWDHRRYGTVDDPIRQSDLNAIASSYGCAERFARQKREVAAGLQVERGTIAGSKVSGTAGHEVIARVMRSETSKRAVLDRGEAPPTELLERAFDQELARAAVDKTTAARLSIEWYGDNPIETRAEVVHMVCGLLRELATRAVDVVAVEAPFVVQLGDFWLTGTVDMAYRPRVAPMALALADWKLGAQRLPQVILDHGYQTGVYAHALAEGTFWPGTEQARVIGEFPVEIHIVHLRDYLPYSKRQSKTVDRPEEVAFFGFPRGTEIAVLPAEREVKMKKDGSPAKVRTGPKDLPEIVLSDRRGPAWYRARRRREDTAELRTDLRRVVSTVRLGQFVKSKDEHCERCPFKGPCLGDGYGAAGDEARDLELAMRGVDLSKTGTDELAA